jgi:hypothetical protein
LYSIPVGRIAFAGGAEIPIVAFATDCELDQTLSNDRVREDLQMIL